MEEFNFPILKAVKKTTYNSIVHIAKLNNSSEEIKIARSQSFKKITNFAPKLKPRKSTFIPTPLKLNQNNNLGKENEEAEKQLSGDEIEIISNDSSCSITSSDFENSLEGEGGSIKKKNMKKEFKMKPYLKISSNNVFENMELDNLEDYDSNTKEFNNIKAFRKKMMKIKSKAIISKFRETEEKIPDHYKNIFNLGLKKNENELNLLSNLYSAVNLFDNKNNINEKTKSIIDFLSNSSKKNNQEI